MVYWKTNSSNIKESITGGTKVKITHTHTHTHTHITNRQSKYLIISNHYI
jgi:hypothetical protein